MIRKTLLMLLCISMPIFLSCMGKNSTSSSLDNSFVILQGRVTIIGSSPHTEFVLATEKEMYFLLGEKSEEIYLEYQKGWPLVIGVEGELTVGKVYAPKGILVKRWWKVSNG